MERHITFWCQKIIDNWHEATMYDYAFTTGWIIVVGFLIAKLTADVPR